MTRMERLIMLAGSPVPLRTILVRKLLERFPVGSFEARLRAGGFKRPYYAWPLYYAAIEAKGLGHKAMTAIEVGVAGGNGLVLLCDYRDQIEAATGIKIHLIGLDAGGGLPPSTEPRDLLYCWPSGSFKMDIPKLEARLAGRAKVIIGNVSETARALDIPADAPLGAIFYDLDYYTSTMSAFALFDKPNLLPRVWCYFDDVSGSPENAYTDYIGVRGAIKDFDSSHDPLESHLTKAYTFGFDTFEVWQERMYIYHRMSHPDYNTCITDSVHVLPLT